MALEMAYTDASGNTYPASHWRVRFLSVSLYELSARAVLRGCRDGAAVAPGLRPDGAPDPAAGRYTPAKPGPAGADRVPRLLPLPRQPPRGGPLGRTHARDGHPRRVPPRDPHGPRRPRLPAPQRPGDRVPVRGQVRGPSPGL